jgi:hypothetical protein
VDHLDADPVVIAEDDRVAGEFEVEQPALINEQQGKMALHRLWRHGAALHLRPSATSLSRIRSLMADGRLAERPAG